jgi:hypothetical protein
MRENRDVPYSSIVAATFTDSCCMQIYARTFDIFQLLKSGGPFMLCTIFFLFLLVYTVKVDYTSL